MSRIKAALLFWGVLVLFVGFVGGGVCVCLFVTSKQYELWKIKATL